MRNLSSTFKNELNNDNRKYLEWVDITLKDGTVLNLTNKDIWNNGIKIEDAVSGTSDFQIGTAIINKATISLNNIYDDFSDYIFDGAEITASIGLEINTSVEKIKLFTGIVMETPTTNSSIINLTCYDMMYKFDRDYSESKLIYPATRGQIIRDACSVCGVSLQTVTFDNDNYVINEKPSTEKLTFRQLISWIAQMGGQWCRCDSYGRLCIDWYDLKSYEAEIVDDKKFHTFSSNKSTTINNEDVVITGVQVTECVENLSDKNDTNTFLYGKTGYVLSISGNKLIPKGKGGEIASIVGKRLVGMRFRPFSISTMNTPAVEAGDICFVVDRKGNKYKSVITSHKFQIGNSQNVACEAKSAERNSAKQYSLISQTEVANRNQFVKEKTDRDKAIADLANRISKSSGTYTTEEVNLNGGKTFYLHNKPLVKDSDIIWKMTAEAWSVSTDGGNTWNAGMTVDGDTIVRILDAVGVRANWIQTGEFKVADKNGNEMFYVDCDTGVVRIKAQSFSLTNNKTITDIAYDCIEDELNKVGKLLVLEFTTNASTYQKVDAKGNYTPDFTKVPLVITPRVSFKGTEVTKNLQFVWKKKIDDKEVALEDGEIVSNGVLTVQNNLGNDTIRYICYVTYNLDGKKYVANGYLDFVRVEDGEKGEDAVTLRIESSRGTVFKNDQAATVLSVVIYKGSERITDSATMKSVFGNAAYLQWKWQRLDDESFGIISAGDSRFGDNGFTFTLSPEDVDTKVTFMCELMD